jgi:hypothetical protein
MGRGHADDGHRVIVDQDLAAQDARRAAELGLPEIVGEDHHGAGARRCVIFGFDHPAERGSDPEHREIISRNDLRGGVLGIAAGGEH